MKSSPDSEQLLADLLAQLIEQKQRGQDPNFEHIACAHPELRDELRRLWAVAEMAEVLGQAASTTTVVPNPGVAAVTGPLPRTFGEYDLVSELGRGGMGVVYKAWDRQLQRFVALKMVLRGEHASSTDLSRFRGEAKAAAGLSHPNIIPVYQVGESDGQAYFVMKYISGPTLAAVLSKGPLPPMQAAQMMAAIARAVHHAHDKGILHRDLKPSNILLDPEGQPQVMDFGLAKKVAADSHTATQLTVTGAILGTPSYMSPEQAAGLIGELTPAADVYSLGSILYEMLTGRPPFQAATVVDVLLQVRMEEPVRPRLLNSRIDPDLEMICLKCLEKRPQDRYPSALALAEDLERFLRSEAVQARSSSLSYFFGRLFRETHHAPVMENWDVLWMWHSLTLLLLCVATNALHWWGLKTHPPYLILWSVGLVVWAAFFWQWRRLGGPVTFVERQMAHAWAAGVAASIGAFIVEWLLGLQVLVLTPVLAVMAGMVFIFMAGTLSGWFYIPAALCFLAPVPMKFFPDISQVLFGAVSAFGFFIPGWRLYRVRRNSRYREEEVS